MKHYCCLRAYFPKTRSERIVHTVKFFPSEIPIPKVGIEDFLQQAATDIISILQDKPSTTTLGLQIGDTTRNALLEISNILQRTESLPKAKPLFEVVDKEKINKFLHLYVNNSKAKHLR